MSNLRESRTLKVTSDIHFCGEHVPAERVVASAEGYLRYAVVYLDGVHYTGQPTREPLYITNQRCAFVPHVQAGIVGSGLEVTNDDPILHNTHLSLQIGSRTRSLLNIALPREGVRLDASRGTRHPGVIQIKCDAHDWMSAYLVLFEHPYHAVTDARGRFTIPNVPAGTYKLKVWHEALGELESEVLVGAGESTVRSFTFGG